MKDSPIAAWRSTIIGCALLGFLAFESYTRPNHVQEPESIITLAAGLYAIFRSKE